MLRFSSLKITAILISCFLGAYLALPSLLGREGVQQVNRFLPSFLVPQSSIVLGLDLQGGLHVLLEADTADLIRTETRTLQEDTRRILRENQIRITGGVGIQPRGVQVRLAEGANRELALTRLRELATPLTNAALGATGARRIDVLEAPDGAIRLEITEAGLRDKIARSISQAIEVLRRRVDPAGVLEPQIQQQGADRILLQLPGSKEDPEEIKKRINQTAKLEFRMVAEPGANPADVEELPYAEGGTITVMRRIDVAGEDLTFAEAGFDQRNSEPIVSFRFNIRGAQRFGQVTSENVGKPFAIVLDNRVISAPRIIQPITGGQGQISGRFTVEDANRLAILLRAGALPIKLSIVEERTVGPGLGKDSIEAAKLASWIAGVFVIIFTLATYGLLGVIALVAVFVNVLLIFGLMSAVGSTLTLPGIAGIVLTMGMAIDSNVLIYERIREESRLGRSVISSLDSGFSRALATIVDANLTTLIAGVVLFFLGTGPVRGFAVTLCFGIITTIFTAFTLTRLMVALWYRWAKPKAITI
jgi:preprotein translocase subunit SecD